MRKASEIITALFRERFGPEFAEKARTTSGLFSSWSRIVAEVWPGPQDEEKGEEHIPPAAVHSRIRELERGVLLVEADHPGWIQILQTKQTELLNAVQRRYKDLDIHGIAFRLSRGPIFQTDDTEGMKSEVLVPTPEAAGSESSAPGTRTPEFRSRDKSEDEDFYAALDELKKSIRKRNGL